MESSIEYSQYFDEFPYWMLASTGLFAAVSGCWLQPNRLRQSVS